MVSSFPRLSVFRVLEFRSSEVHILSYSAKKTKREEDIRRKNDSDSDLDSDSDSDLVILRSDSLPSFEFNFIADRLFIFCDFSRKRFSLAKAFISFRK